MPDRVKVFIFGTDSISQAGIVSQLRPRPETEVVDDVDDATVAIVVGETVEEELLRVVRGVQRNGCPRVILVATALDEQGVLAAVEAGVCGLLRRREAQPERLAAAVVAAAAGEGSLPPDLLGRLLTQVGDLQRQVLAPRGMTLSGMAERELAVLRLVADGYDTTDIARELAYSERTVKNVIHDVTSRLQLRNRTHAVAYAVRQGLI